MINDLPHHARCAAYVALCSQLLVPGMDWPDQERAKTTARLLTTWQPTVDYDLATVLVLADALDGEAFTVTRKGTTYARLDFLALCRAIGSVEVAEVIAGLCGFSKVGPHWSNRRRDDHDDGVELKVAKTFAADSLWEWADAFVPDRAA
jgi:hypothetical protein